MTVVIVVVSAFIHISARGTVACETQVTLTVVAASCVYTGRIRVTVVLVIVSAFIHVSTRGAVACKT